MKSPASNPPFDIDPISIDVHNPIVARTVMTMTELDTRAAFLLRRLLSERVTDFAAWLEEWDALSRKRLSLGTTMAAHVWAITQLSED